MVEIIQGGLVTRMATRFRVYNKVLQRTGAGCGICGLEMGVSKRSTHNLFIPSFTTRSPYSIIDVHGSSSGSQSVSQSVIEWSDGIGIMLCCYI